MRLPRPSAQQCRDGVLLGLIAAVSGSGLYLLAGNLGLGRPTAVTLVAAHVLWFLLQVTVVLLVADRGTVLWSDRSWPMTVAIVVPPIVVTAVGVAVLGGHPPARAAGIAAGYGALLAVTTVRLVRKLRTTVRDAEPMSMWGRWASEPVSRITRRIDGLSGAIQSTPSGMSDRVRLLRHLGHGCKARYAWTGERADLERAVGAFREALREPSASPHVGVLRIELAGVLFTRFRDHGHVDDLQQAVQFGERGLATLPADQRVVRTIGLANLATIYDARHARLGRLADLEHAVALAEQAVATSPRRAEARGPVSDGLALILLQRYDRGDRLEDLERAIELCRSALAKLRGPTPLRASLCDTLAGALERRYQRTGAAGDLQEADRLLGEAALVRAHRVDFVTAEGNRALVLAARYGRTGDPDDLRRAVDGLRRSLAELPEEAPFRLGVQGNLATLLAALARRTGELDTLDEAVDLQDKVLSVLPDDAAGQGVNRCALAGLLLARYELSSDLADLNQAIERAEESLTNAALGRRERRYAHGILGACYSRRGVTQLGRADDLDRAFAHLRAAFEATPEATPEQVLRLDHLAAVELFRSADAGQAGRVEEAIKLLERSIEAEPADSPSRLAGLGNLGDALSVRWERTGRTEDLEAAIRQYRAACARGGTASAWTVLQAAPRWGELEAGRGAWEQAAAAYGIALRAMRELFEVQPLREHRETALQTTSGLPARAAYALAMAGRPRDAVAVLEDGRAVLLTEALAQGQADLAMLSRLGHDTLARRFREARDRVRELEQPGLRPRLPGSSPEPVRGADMRLARAELAQVIDAIRAVPGLNGFLQRPTFIDAVAASRHGPIVYLAGTDDGGVALVVGMDGHADDAEPVWLPDLTSEAVEVRFKELRHAHDRRDKDRAGWYATLDHVTAWLWTAAMGPVLGALVAESSAVLIPAGLLGLLPLHAAWTRHQNRRCYAVDRLKLSYAPNARTLTAVQATAEHVPGDSLLAVADPRSVSMGRLLYADSEAEAASRRFETVMVLRQQAATVAQVVRCLPRYEVHHFACHATANLVSPLDSALILADDERLSLRTLLGRRLDGSRGLSARLAVLSACQTQLSGTVLPDEVVSLPTGLLQAGVAGVIASYWAVPDAATGLLMTRFYDCWKAAGCDPSEALRRAQCWLRDTTNREKREWLTAAADAGRLPWDAATTLVAAVKDRDPNGLDYDHPAKWAAFAYTGA